jgi:hypothetical protein
VENWDHGRDWPYRVVALDGAATYQGTIRKDPIDKDEIVVAAFTGNSNGDRHMKPDLIANMQTMDPDLLFFSGDQSYDHTEHLYAWLLFGRQFGSIIKDRPTTVCIPDDHDIGQGNLWGADGRKSSGAGGCADGGYVHPVEYVNEVQFAQTANLPDPYDPTPVPRGITVYYTSLNVGGVDFAIIEDRKFKSGPLGRVETPGHDRPDLINDPAFDRASVDLPDAKLLGERQLQFLREWGARWEGVQMKAVLSQTIFVNAAHQTGPWRVVADLDSNGWPQSGRNRALREIRKAFAYMIAGDQHLGTVIHHGVDEWGDAGFGIVRFNKHDRTITAECWPRNVDVSTAAARQYPGWPVTVRQEDNYGRAAVAYLPERHIHGQTDPVVQVIRDSSGDIVYTVRAHGNRFRPKVFEEGTYTIRVGEGQRVVSLEGVEAMGKDQEKTISVDLE